MSTMPRRKICSRKCRLLSIYHSLGSISRKLLSTSLWSTDRLLDNLKESSPKRQRRVLQLCLRDSNRYRRLLNKIQPTSKNLLSWEISWLLSQVNLTKLERKSNSQTKYMQFLKISDICWDLMIWEEGSQSW